MAKFTFRLATLLRLREAARDERRAELGQAYRADEIVARREEQLAEEFVGLQHQARCAAAPGTLDVDRLVDAGRYDLLLRSQREELRRQRQAVQAEIERRRLALVEADRQVRVLEKLRERQHDRHLQAESLREVKRLDETASRCRSTEEDP